MTSFMTLLFGTSSPGDQSWLAREEIRIANSSTHSPDLNVMSSNSRQSFPAFASYTLSAPTRILRIASHASFAVSFTASPACISG
jgi:hypothetical protein